MSVNFASFFVFDSKYHLSLTNMQSNRCSVVYASFKKLSTPNILSTLHSNFSLIFLIQALICFLYSPSSFFFFLVTYLIQHFASIALAASGGNYRKGLKILKNKKHFSFTKKPEKFTLRRFTDAKKNASLQVRKSQKIFFLVFNYSQKTQ